MGNPGSQRARLSDSFHSPGLRGKSNATPGFSGSETFLRKRHKARMMRTEYIWLESSKQSENMAGRCVQHRAL